MLYYSLRCIVTLEAVGAGVQETLMETDDTTRADTTPGAANFIGKYKSCVCVSNLVLL